jgi:group I intron endonuclease
MDDLNCAGIYAIKHVESGKVYVGQSQNIAKRIRDHRYAHGRCWHISNAVRLYGWNAFEVEILERADDLILLNEREQYWIDLFDSANPEKGYNICRVAGSFRHMKHSEETKRKISLIHKGKHLSAEHKAKLSASHINKHFTITKKRVRKNQEFITSTEAAIILGMSPTHVRRMIDLGALQGFRIPLSKHRRVSKLEVERIRMTLQPTCERRHDLDQTG